MSNIVWAKPDGTLAITVMASASYDTHIHAKELLERGSIDPSWVAIAHGHTFAAHIDECRYRDGAIVHVGTSG